MSVPHQNVLVLVELCVDILKELLAALRLPTSQLAATLMVFGAAVATRRLWEPSNPYHVWVLLFAASAILLGRGFAWVAQHYGENRILRRKKKRLQALTPPERQLLWHYFEHQTNTLTLDIMAPIVARLLADDFLVRVSQVGRGFEFPIGIQPWVWEHLNKNAHLLDL
jgi:hypothetical protein